MGHEHIKTSPKALQACLYKYQMRPLTSVYMHLKIWLSYIHLGDGLCEAKERYGF